MLYCKTCPVCRLLKPMVCMDGSGRCIPCRREERVQQKRRARVRAALNEGRSFVPRTLHDAHVKQFAKHNLNHIDAQRKIALREHQKALEIFEKPWLAYPAGSADRWRIRYNMDPAMQLRERLRRQMTKAAKRDGIAYIMRAALSRGWQSPTVERALGYTIAQLRRHLEALFTPGMCWHQFMLGNIHIDHKTPQAAFDLADDAQFAACWSLSNLQPMWAADNMRKSDRMSCGTSARVLRSRNVMRCVAQEQQCVA